MFHSALTRDFNEMPAYGDHRLMMRSFFGIDDSPQRSDGRELVLTNTSNNIHDPFSDMQKEMNKVMEDCGKERRKEEESHEANRAEVTRVTRAETSRLGVNRKGNDGADCSRSQVKGTQVSRSQVEGTQVNRVEGDTAFVNGGEIDRPYSLVTKSKVKGAGQKSRMARRVRFQSEVEKMGYLE